MKQFILLSLLLLSHSLYANECKYFKENFLGNYQVKQYNCTSDMEENYFKCYSKSDLQTKVSEVSIGLLPLGIGTALSINQLDKNYNSVTKMYLSEVQLNKGEVIDCNQTEENGVTVFSLKQELKGLNGATVYTMLTKRNQNLEFEMFSFLAGVTIKQVFVLEAF